MFLEWPSGFWTSLVFGGLALAFVSIVTIKFDKKLIRIAKSFESNDESSVGLGGGIFFILLQTTPVIASFLVLIVMTLFFLACNILD